MADSALLFMSPAWRWARWFVLAGVLIVVGSLVFLPLSGARWTTYLLVGALAVNVANAGFQSRSRTLVSGGEIRVRKYVRDRVVLAQEVADVTTMTRWSPVRLRLISGETIELPYVPADRLDDVRGLLIGPSSS